MSEIRAARPHALDRLVERLLGDPQQRRRLFRHLADRQRDRAVAEVAVERRADVDRDDVAFVQHPAARRDAVDHLFVDRRANRRRVAVIALERRRRARLRESASPPARRDPPSSRPARRARPARSALRRPAGRRRACARAPPPTGRRSPRALRADRAAAAPPRSPPRDPPPRDRAPARRRSSGTSAAPGSTRPAARDCAVVHLQPLEHDRLVVVGALHQPAAALARTRVADRPPPTGALAPHILADQPRCPAAAPAPPPAPRCRRRSADRGRP